MSDVNEILQDARGNVLNAICKLSVISSIDVDTFTTVEQYKTLVHGIKDIIDTVNEDLYSVSISFEG